jgi:hypothetical protein
MPKETETLSQKSPSCIFRESVWWTKMRSLRHTVYHLAQFEFDSGMAFVGLETAVVAVDMASVAVGTMFPRDPPGGLKL